jgi:tRNA-splicing ligase RtcB
VELKKILENVWEIPKSAGMLVPARIFASEKLMEAIRGDRSLEQIANVATLPGIQKYAIALPDIHEGYGFPVGGVAAFDMETGIISPGGIGYDINCGVRILKSSLALEQLQSLLPKLMDDLFENVPSGLGRGGKLRVSDSELDEIMIKGAQWMLEKGFAEPEDITHMEENGQMAEADPGKVSKKAKDRGRDQIGTLGSGNHFFEIQVVDKIFDQKIAEVFGLWQNQILVEIHCGSRGLGHQVATDYINVMQTAMPKYHIVVVDRELACAPFNTPEGQDYYKAMCASINFAFANRQYLTFLARESWRRVFNKISQDLNLVLLYDVCHNTGKVEEYEIEGVKRKLIVHRKGATRSFGPGNPHIPEDYRAVGQPVLIPGNMGIASYIMAGTKEAEEISFGSCAHGAGRVMSRAKAKKTYFGKTLKEQLESQGIFVRSESMAGLAEEAPGAYKDIDEVALVSEAVGLAKRVARVRPLGVVKG